MVITVLVLYALGQKTALQRTDEPFKSILVAQRIAIIAISPVFYRDPQVLAVVDRIVQNESKGDPTAQNPNSSAYGLCQFLDGTWKYVQDKWKMELEREDERDQLYACTQLYEEEGIIHWITSTQL